MKKDQSKLSEISIKPDFPFNPSASDMMPPAMVQEIDQVHFFSSFWNHCESIWSQGGHII